MTDSRKPYAIDPELLRQQGFDPEQSRGLFIGLGKFSRDTFSPVPYAVEDAVDLAHLFSFELGLIDPRQVTLAITGEPQDVDSIKALERLRSAKCDFLDPTQSEIYAWADDLVEDAPATKDGLILLTVASHGVHDVGHHIFAAADTLEKRADRTGVWGQELTAAFSEVEEKGGAQRRLAIFDTCRSKWVARSGNGPDTFEWPKGMGVLYASVLDDFTYDDKKKRNGAFSFAIVDGLQGKAEGNRQGFITLRSLERFADHRMAEFRKKAGLARRPGNTDSSVPSYFEDFPLAVHPSRFRALTEYRETRNSHRLKLLSIIEAERPGAVIRVEHLARFEMLLPLGEPPEEVDKIFALLEQLGDDEISQLALDSFLSRNSPSPFSPEVPSETSHSASESSLPAVKLQSLSDSRLSPSWAARSGRDEAGHWADLEVGGVIQRMRWIEKGEFKMGSPPGEEGREEREGPQHTVTLTEPFWLGDTPCTQALWQAVMGENPSKFQGSDRPVEHVSWEDTKRFLGQLGSGIRLPTEAEWEYACRAGTEGARYGANVERIAWYVGNSDGETHAVKDWEPNPWGLYDMLGNVFEWCEDAWLRKYTSDPAKDPVNDAGTERVIRGGSCYSIAQFVRAAYRAAFDPSYRWSSLGFRLARGPE